MVFKAAAEEQNQSIITAVTYKRKKRPKCIKHVGLYKAKYLKVRPIHLLVFVISKKENKENYSPKNAS